jgi:hypothetical protein
MNCQDIEFSQKLSQNLWPQMAVGIYFALILAK